MSKAQIKIQQLTRKVNDQKRVIGGLQTEIEKKVKPSAPMILKSEHDKINKQLNNEINKNDVIGNILNEVNKRIDDLIARPINIVINEKKDDKAQHKKNYKLSQMEVTLLVDKTKLESINESLEDCIKTLEEQLVLNEKNFHL